MPLDSSNDYPDERLQPVFNAPPATLWLCAAIIAAYVGFDFASDAWQIRLLELFAFIPASFLDQFASDGEGFSAAEWLKLISYAFLHGDLLHLIVNIGMLLAFGTVVERVLGKARFLLLFFVTTAAAALAQAIGTGPEPIIVIGASGGGYGLIGASMPMLFTGGVARGRRDAMLFVVAIMGVNLLIGLTGLGNFLTGGEIAWQAHIGGFVAGLLLVHALWRRA